MSSVKPLNLTRNQTGIAHLVIPIAIIGLVAVVGTVLLVSSRAATPAKAPKIIDAYILVDKPSYKGRPDPNNKGNYCAAIKTRTFVETSAQVNRVRVVITAHGSKPIAYSLREGTNKNLWSATKTYRRCTDQPGQAIKAYDDLHALSGITAEAVYSRGDLRKNFTGSAKTSRPVNLIDTVIIRR